MKRAIFLSIIVMTVVVAGWSEAEGAEWVRYFENARQTFFYDQESISRRSEDTVRVLDKQAPASEEERQKDIAGLKEIAGGQRDFSSYAYTVGLTEIHCKKGAARLLSLKAYSSQGSVLLSFEDDEDDWAQFKPDTPGEVLFAIACLKEGKK